MFSELLTYISNRNMVKVYNLQFWFSSLVSRAKETISDLGVSK